MDGYDKAAVFFREQGMHPGQIDIEELCRLFMAEMSRGLTVENSSLAMLPSYISPTRDIPVDMPVLALDAGGTHFRAATVYFNREHQPVIENFRQLPMPGTGGIISSKNFFAAMAAAIKDMVVKGQRIGFCFSYPVEMLPEKDGRLIRLAKEMQVTGIAGQMVGQNLLQALQAGGRLVDSQIVLLNDTVAALLAGMGNGEKGQSSAHIGLILGTGTNTCYLEKGGRISKIDHWPAERQMIINVESGAFDKAPRGLIDREFDAWLKDPGCFQLEKMISGRYLGSLFLAVVKKAAASGLFSESYTASLVKLKEVRDFPTTELNRILLIVSDREVPELLYGANQKDERMVVAMAELLVERAAILTAGVLSALVKKTGCGQDPCCPVTITAEGSTFYRLSGLQNKIIRQMTSFLTDQQGLHFRFCQVENAVLIGSALAALAE